MTWSAREALLFAAKFVVLFAALAFPWRWLGAAHSLAFSLGATVAMETVVDDREFTVRFAPDEDAGDAGDAWAVRFSGTNVLTGAVTKTGIEAREISYLPFATFLALVLASPVPWSRQRAIFLRGALLLGGRLALAVGLPVAHYVGALGQGSALDVASRVAFWALIEPPDMTYAAAVLAFLLGLALTAPRAPAPARLGLAGGP